MVLANIDGGFYKLVLVLHIFCAIVGFGAVLLNGVYGQQMKVRMQSGKVDEAIGIFEANELVSKIGEYFIYAVFVFGFEVMIGGHNAVELRLCGIVLFGIGDFEHNIVEVSGNVPGTGVWREISCHR